MTAPENLVQTYQNLTLEVSGFYERLCFARQEGDPEAELEMEREMNESLEDLGDVIRAMGSTALSA